MRMDIEVAVIPPSVRAQYEISREEILAVGRNIGIVCAAAVAARLFMVLIKG